MEWFMIRIANVACLFCATSRRVLVDKKMKKMQKSNLEVSVDKLK